MSDIHTTSEVRRRRRKKKISVNIFVSVNFKVKFSQVYKEVSSMIHLTNLKSIEFVNIHFVDFSTITADDSFGIEGLFQVNYVEFYWKIPAAFEKSCELLHNHNDSLISNVKVKRRMHRNRIQTIAFYNNNENLYIANNNDLLRILHTWFEIIHHFSMDTGYTYEFECFSALILQSFNTLLIEYPR